MPLIADIDYQMCVEVRDEAEVFDYVEFFAACSVEVVLVEDSFQMCEGGCAA